MGHLRKLWIPGPAGRLEAALRSAPNPTATAVVAHPHPLHGGTMHNPVVFHSERELHRLGMTTMRFNFRGVGSSEGEHDHGDGEVADVAAATAWLRGLRPDVPLVMVGYSFGSMCGARHAAADPTVAAMIGIGVPVRHRTIPELARLRRPLAVVQGADDELGPPDEVLATLDGAEPAARMYVVADASHLFPDRAREAAAAVRQAMTDILETGGF